MGRTIVIALGGNALEDSAKPTAENQLSVIKDAMTNISQLVKEGTQIVLTHGNGPQVGRISLQNEAAKNTTPPMPFDVCGAMSQGMIGYHIQQSFKEILTQNNRKADVATVVTQVVVDENDKAFRNPTKPIGPFYSKEEGEALTKERGYIIKEDSGRGYRRMVASPKPLEIVELDVIKSLVNSGTIVVAVGGGGIPVKRSGSSLVGIEAVIDKDFASAKLAEDLDADTLVILTEVERVALNFGKPDQVWLSNISIDEACRYMEEGHFAKGSMLPKIEACVAFVKSQRGRKALITSLSKVSEALDGATGTHITN